MPTAVDQLTPQATDAQRKAAISETIAQLMKEGMPQDQAVAMANEMVSKKMGNKKEPGTGL